MGPKFFILILFISFAISVKTFTQAGSSAPADSIMPSIYGLTISPDLHGRSLTLIFPVMRIPVMILSGWRTQSILSILLLLI